MKTDLTLVTCSACGKDICDDSPGCPLYHFVTETRSAEPRMMLPRPAQLLAQSRLAQPSPIVLPGRFQLVRVGYLVLFGIVNLALVALIYGGFTPSPPSILLLLLKLAAIVTALTSVAYEIWLERLKSGIADGEMSLLLARVVGWRSVMYGIGVLGWLADLTVSLV
jgi:hypothetical protein